MLLADPSFSTILLLPEDSAVYTDDLAMQLVQNAGRRHLMMDDTYDAVWSDSLMPLELLAQPENSLYMATIDRHDMTIGECVGSGYFNTSFGSIALDESAGTVTVQGYNDSFKISMPADADVHAVVLDKQTGEVLYERAVKL